MQIHEIARRALNEGPLKGVSSNPVNFGNTIAAMPQYTVAPSKITFAPKIAAAPGTTTATTPAPATAPTPVTTPAPISTTDTANNWKTIKGSRAPTTPGKAGFARNAAEYFANKIMNAAGIPLDQQGQYHPGGHMATRMGQGLTAIANAEHSIASNLAQEYANQGTLNRQPQQLTPAAIKSAADMQNQAGARLQLNFDNIVNLTMQYVAQYKQHLQQRKVKQAKHQFDIDQLKQDLANAEVLKQTDRVRQITDELRQAGVTMQDINAIRSQAMASAQQLASTPGINKMLSNQPAAQPATVKAPTPAPAMAESLTWSKNVDPSRQLYRKMKQGQKH